MSGTSGRSLLGVETISVIKTSIYLEASVTTLFAIIGDNRRLLSLGQLRTSFVPRVTSDLFA
jgi:hypothetical protein